jgi:hypothetical protein
VSSLRVMPNSAAKRYVEVGNTLALACNYVLEGSSLYSIKWYREDMEFFRYTPLGILPFILINVCEQRRHLCTMGDIFRAQTRRVSCSATDKSGVDCERNYVRKFCSCHNIP